MDVWESKGQSIDAPAMYGAAITPSDDNDLETAARAVYVGTGGTVKVTTVGGSTIELINVPSGTMLPIRAKRVFATVVTGTVADGMVALW